MGDVVDMTEGGNSVKALLRYIERIESLEAEKTEASDKIKAEKAMAKSAGFNPKVINQILKLRKTDLDKQTTFEAELDAAISALSKEEGELGDWASGFLAQATTARNSLDPNLGGDDA